MNNNLMSINSDNEDYEFVKELDDRAKVLVEKMKDISTVLDNAAYTAILLHHLQQTGQEFFSLLFYAVVKKYSVINATKNDMRNYNHCNNEIYSVFIHKKSPLFIPALSELRDLETNIVLNINTEECVICFENILSSLVKGLITEHFESFKEALLKQNDSFPFQQNVDQDMSRLQELKVLETTHRNIRDHYKSQQKSRCLPSDNVTTRKITTLFEFQIQAIELSLTTQHEYFLNQKRYAYTVKSSSNTSSNKTFLGSIYTKQLKKYKIKGHHLEESSPPNVTPCCICDSILWGPYPQGLICRYCQKVTHICCKDIIGVCCFENKKLKRSETKDSRQSKSQTPIKRHSSKGFDSLRNIFGFTDESLNSSLEANLKPIAVDGCSRVSECELEDMHPESVETNQTNGENEVNYATSAPEASVILKNELAEEKLKAGIKHVKSLNAKKSMISNSNYRKMSTTNDVTRSKSTRTPSPEKPSLFSRSKSQNRTGEKSDARRNSSFPSLVTIDYNDDSEMNVLETFDLNEELNVFTDLPDNYSAQSASYKRLVVLLEFHHKIRFIRMIIKRFKYMLVEPWLQMDQYMELYDSMSLRCINELYILLNNLVSVMDNCIRPNDYDPLTATSVYQWFVEFNEINLHKWLNLSVDLLCTNTLHSVKAHWMEHKRSTPCLNDLLSRQVNRISIVEQLSNMRPLLFSLPMIAVKIVHDLNQFPELQEESKIWENVLRLLQRVPYLIDKRCMHIVYKVNEGLIEGTITKNKTDIPQELLPFVFNFPKTLFQNGFFDFQLVKIANLRETKHDSTKFMAIYVRDEIDAASICYDNMLIILQKEVSSTASSSLLDKYLFKYFKTPNQHRLLPLFQFDEVHVTKQNVKDCIENQYELTVILMSQAILLQIRFTDENIRNVWFNHISNNSNNPSCNANQTSSITTNDLASLTESSEFVEFIDDQFPDTFGTTDSGYHDKIGQIQTALDDAVNSLSLANKLIEEENGGEVSSDPLLSSESDQVQTPGLMLSQMTSLLSQYASLCSSMIKQSQAVAPSLLIQRDILAFNIRCIRQIGQNVDHISQQYIEQFIEADSKSDDEDSFNDSKEAKSPDNCRNIPDYIDLVVKKAKSNRNSSINQPDCSLNKID